MEIVLAAVADAANVSLHGKLNILGTFDTIPAYASPVRAPQMVLAITLRAEYEDRCRTHTVELDLVDEDGRQLLTARAEPVVGEIQPGQFSHTHVIMPIPSDLVFERFGRYRMRVNIQKGERRDVVFQVSQAHIDTAD